MSKALFKNVLTLAWLAHMSLSVRMRQSAVPGEKMPYVHTQKSPNALERSSTRGGTNRASSKSWLASMLFASRRPHGFNLVGHRTNDPVMRADVRNPVLSPPLLNSHPQASGVASHRFSSMPVMHHVDGQTHEIIIAEKSDEELAAECLGEFECSVEYIDDLLHGLSAEKNPTPQLTQTIEKLEEVRGRNEKIAIATSDFMEEALADEPIVKSHEASAIECLEGGCSVESIEALLGQLRAERNTNPQLTETIQDLEQLLAKEKETETIVGRLAQGSPPDASRAVDELAVECIEIGCSVESMEGLLQELKADKNTNPQLIKKMEDELVEASKRDDAINNLLNGLLVQDATA